MLRLVLSGLLAALPSTASAATATYWYFNPSLATVGGESRQTQGMITVNGDHAGQTSSGWEPFLGEPGREGPEMSWYFTSMQFANSWSVTYGGDGLPEKWGFSVWADQTYRDEWTISDQWEIDGTDLGAPFPVETAEVRYLAGPGSWFRSERQFVDAVKQTGAVPVPLPAPALLLGGGLLGLIAFKRRSRLARSR